MDKLLSTLGTVSAIIGAQWGDEGKGKVTDLLAEHFDVIARACGGANAGHTIKVGDKKHVFSLLPSGCLHPGKKIILGAGMVIHLPTLLAEIETLQAAGVEIIDNLYISPAAHIVFDYHKQIDAIAEERRADSKTGKIGTTKKGIGPAYMDKAQRVGLRLECLQLPDADLRLLLEEQQVRIRFMYGFDIDIDQELTQLVQARSIFQKRLLLNATELLYMFLREKQKVLIEGAQATLLDLDHGTYPYVTSSNTTVTGALQGLGLAPRMLQSCIGIAKAYCTRVGEGYFPTAADEDMQVLLRDRGGEYGAVTGRPRRCGWLHIPDLRYAAMINGFTHWNITKLDVLDTLESIPVGIDNDGDGKAVFKELPGWQSSTVGIRSFDELPENAKSYLKFIEEQSGVHVSLIGTGPERNDMITRI